MNVGVEINFFIMFHRQGIENSIADKDGKVLYKEYIAIRYKDGDVGFYTPTQCDILAEDWKVIVE